MKTILAILTLAAFATALLFGCADNLTEEERTREALYHRKIDSISNCSQLQEEFNIADEEHDRILMSRPHYARSVTDRMVYIHARMEEVGCYD